MVSFIMFVNFVFMLNLSDVRLLYYLGHKVKNFYTAIRRQHLQSKKVYKKEVWYISTKHGELNIVYYLANEFYVNL